MYIKDGVKFVETEEEKEQAFREIREAILKRPDNKVFFDILFKPLARMLAEEAEKEQAEKSEGRQ